MLFRELNSRVSPFALKELYKQWELVKSGKMSSVCTGQFKTVMGLPCAHMLIDWKDKVIAFETIHSQWRIDDRQFKALDGGMNSGNMKLKELLGDFEDKYQEWSLTEKDNALNMISQLLNGPSSKLLEPNIVAHKGRPQRSKSRKESTSTQRNPSEFEIVDKIRKCGRCTGHTSRSCRDQISGVEFMDCYTPCLTDVSNIGSHTSHHSSSDFFAMWITT